MHRLIEISLATIDYDDIAISLYWPILNQNSIKKTSIISALPDSPEIYEKFPIFELWRNNVGYQTGMIKSSSHFVCLKIRNNSLLSVFLVKLRVLFCRKNGTDGMYFILLYRWLRNAPARDDIIEFDLKQRLERALAAKQNAEKIFGWKLKEKVFIRWVKA